MELQHVEMANELADEVMQLCEDGEYDRSFYLARCALFHEELPALKRAYMNVILTQNPMEDEVERAQEACACLWQMCQEHPYDLNVVKVYYDVFRVVRRAKKRPSVFERVVQSPEGFASIFPSRGTSHQQSATSGYMNFIPIDPCLLDSFLLDREVSMENNMTTDTSNTIQDSRPFFVAMGDGVTTDTSNTVQDLQPAIASTMAQDSTNASSTSSRDATMKTEPKVVYSDGERKEILDKARSALDFIFADDFAGSTMVKNAFFPDSLYENKENGVKQPDGSALEGFTLTQRNNEAQGFPMPYRFTTPLDIVDNHHATNFQSYTQPHQHPGAQTKRAADLIGSLPVYESHPYPHAQGYNTAIQGVNDFQSFDEYEQENQPFAGAQADNIVSRGDPFQDLRYSQHSPFSHTFDESGSPDVPHQITEYGGHARSQSFIPAWAFRDMFDGIPGTYQFKGDDKRFGRGFEDLAVPQQSDRNQARPSTPSKRLLSTHGMTPSPGFTEGQGTPVPHSFHGSQPVNGMYQDLAGAGMFTTKNPTITWAQAKQREIDEAMARFDKRRCSAIERFYGGEYRQNSYHDQGPTIGVDLPAEAGYANAEDLEFSNMDIGSMEDSDLEAGNMNTEAMETDVMGSAEDEG